MFICEDWKLQNYLKKDQKTSCCIINNVLFNEVVGYCILLSERKRDLQLSALVSTTFKPTLKQGDITLAGILSTSKSRSAT